MTADISQAAAEIGTFIWTEGDPISLSWRVDADWSGNYICQVRKTRKVTGLLLGTFTVTAVYNQAPYLGETVFTMTMSEHDSKLIPAGKYFTDLQVINGVTRIWGGVRVDPQVSTTP